MLESSKSAGPPISLYHETGFMIREHVESVECYTPGGYHPIDIGDAIINATSQDSYTILHKLGYGGFSTVWLVKRQRKHPLAGHPLPVSFHALKILRADLGSAQADHELRILERLGQVGKPSHPNVVVLEDSFTISGPNGQHRCIVFPFLGLSLYSREAINNLTPSQRYHICQQLASAVAFMHSHDVCHGGKALSFSIPTSLYCCWVKEVLTNIYLS